MESYTLTDVVDHVARIRNTLAAHDIPPYAVYSSGATGFHIDGARNVYVLVDINDASTNAAAVGKHIIPELTQWEDPDFIRLACGLRFQLPVSWLTMFTEWEWTLPQTLEDERKHWRSDKYALMNGNEVDVMRRKLACI